MACNCTQDNLMQWQFHGSSLQASRELRHLVAFSQLVHSISNKQNIIPIIQRNRDHRPTAVGIQVYVICWKQDLHPYLHGTRGMADKSWDPLGKAVLTLANKEGTKISIWMLGANACARRKKRNGHPVKCELCDSHAAGRPVELHPSLLSLSPHCSCQAVTEKR